MEMTKRFYVSYLWFATIGATTAIGLCWLVNFVIDPLWYRGGNRLFAQNYVFNERMAKTNFYLANPMQYDCIIFGSSRTTLLDESRIRNRRCFNFSFSGGLLREFVYFAKYIEKYGTRPELVIVAIDSFSFCRDSDPLDSLPDFILSLDKPPNMIKTYLSLDTLDFSIRTLLRKSPYPRYYGSDLRGDVLPGTPALHEPECLAVDADVDEFDPADLKHLKMLREMWPDTRFVGYVPPISAWDVSVLYYDGTLTSYLNIMYQAAHILDNIYDFSIPSFITVNPRNSYDGEHYTAETMDRIAQALDGGKLEFGLDLHALSQYEYQTRFVQAIEQFVGSHNFKVASIEDCSMRTQAR